MIVMPIYRFYHLGKSIPNPEASRKQIEGASPIGKRSSVLSHFLQICTYVRLDQPLLQPLPSHAILFSSFQDDDLHGQPQFMPYLAFSKDLPHRFLKTSLACQVHSFYSFSQAQMHFVTSKTFLRIAGKDRRSGLTVE